MSELNPTAVAFWAFCGTAGYLFGGAHYALVGVCVALGLSVLASLRQ